MAEQRNNNSIIVPATDFPGLHPPAFLRFFDAPPPSPKDAVHAPSLVKDVQRLVGADASAVRAQLGSHFTLTSRRTKKRFVYDGKAAPQCRDRRRSVRVPAIGSGDFESYQLLGRGGFGAVFRAIVHRRLVRAQGTAHGVNGPVMPVGDQ